MEGKEKQTRNAWISGLSLIVICASLLYLFVKWDPDPEPTPQLGRGVTPAMRDAAKDLIVANGWRCDTVTTTERTISVTGLHMWCNDYRYHYVVKDVGGHWMVEVK